MIVSKKTIMNFFLISDKRFMMRQKLLFAPEAMKK
jgi:hypothetical protein